MAYGNYCRICSGTVDNNEYDFAKDMCKECAAEQEQEEIRRSEVARLLNADCEQMVLEV